MVKRSVCFILTFVMIVCSLLTDNSVYAASKLTTLKVDKVYKQFDLDHDGKNEELLFKEHEVPEWEEDMCDYLSVYVNGKKILNVKGIYYKEQYSILLVQMQKKTSVYKGYKQDKIEMRGDRAEMSDFPLYLNTVAGGLDRRDQTIGGFSFVVKIYAVPVVEIIG